ncbi:MAG: hormogonium polysaccharide biosynthesis protein HpsA [Cyanobacteria bacterium J06634_5]
MSADKQTRNRKTTQKPRSDFQRLSRRFMSGLLRSLFLLNSSSRHSRAGFVLPTTVLLLLVMTLTVGALTFRTASRTQSAFLTREQQVIDNIAAPAIDRAKAKLEYLFSFDTRLPGAGTPSSDVLTIMLLNEDSVGEGGVGISARPGDGPYKLPDETQLDINKDGKLDPAWSFPYDIDGDGNINESGEIIAYSLLVDDAVDLNDPKTLDDRSDDIRLEDVSAGADIEKAKNLVVRNGPINTNEGLSNCGGSRAPQQGWLAISEATVEKNFQITTYVNNGKDLGRANSAFELQQVRQASKGNRWGAWFKYDLEIYPGPEFNWNGAMHTDGNLMITDDFRGHMISSHNSCLYSRESSEITMAEKDNSRPRDGIDVDNGDFQGQLILGRTARAYGQRGGSDATRLHIYTDATSAPKENDADTNLTVSTDSIDKRGSETGAPSGNPADIAVDPVALFSRGISQHRSTSTWERDSNWETNEYNEQGRVFNKQDVRSPSLDDFYRADDRYGPSPAYGDTNWVLSDDYSKALGDPILPSDLNANKFIDANAGLDGYWERQSIINGMRVVIGQRLELGDRNGWNFNALTGEVESNTDPLYPPTLTGSTQNKQRQRVTLRDNLAAVQGMVVYHYEDNDGQYPLACMANTVHPGTYQTLVDSRNFKALTLKDSSDADVPLISDFLNGKGTNGWEYDFPSDFKPTIASTTGDSFGVALASNKPLGTALRNLAYFAGDPLGGAPSFKPVQEDNSSAVVHPFPQMAMWGDYSILRRIFDDELDDYTNWNPGITSMSARYAKLSPADKSTLHSASCTMGLLTHNLDTLSKVDWTNSTEFSTSETPTFAGIRTQSDVKSEVGRYLWDAFGAVDGGPAADSLAATYCRTGPGGTYICDQGNPLVASLINAAAPNLSEGALNFVHTLSSFTQVERDRKYGFEASPVSTGSDWLVKRGATTYFFRFPEKCLPTDSSGAVGALFSADTYAIDSDDAANAAGVALACSSVPKYPSLHYLFPIADHGHAALSGGASEEYLDESYISNANAGSDKYKVVGTAADEIGVIAFSPRTTWKLPKEDDNSDAGGTLNPESMEVIDSDGTLLKVSLLDKATYNGREEMLVRVLDIDLGKLTRIKNDLDYWISDKKKAVSGIFYAAREDAVREDSIVRPAANTWANCSTLANLLGSGCRMDTSSNSPNDPPLSEEDGAFIGISLKPVDFAPDPARRPNGFRLNADLNGEDGDLSGGRNADDDGFNREWGFTFVTDNSAYIKGDYNPHTTDGVDTIEEFVTGETLLDSSVGYGEPFYDDRENSNTDEFSTDTVDRWRVSEVLADAVTVLSEKFVDGSVEEGFIRDRDEASQSFVNVDGVSSLTSFNNQQRPLNNTDRFGHAGRWLRASSVYPSSDVSAALWSRPDTSTRGGPTYKEPIWVGRNGESRTRIDLASGITFYRRFTNAEGNTADSSDDVINGVSPSGTVLSGNDFVLPGQRNERALILKPTGFESRVNTTIISGIVPSRAGQSYGGMNNFPRFIESWKVAHGDSGTSVPLFMQGAFLQLNFSTASTAPFDADAWDPGQNPTGNSERIAYYKPPVRSWGYDVALQFSPPGPIAQRFVTIDRPRSEHYRELPLEDPYVANLRFACKSDGSGGFEPLFDNEVATCAP